MIGFLDLTFPGAVLKNTEDTLAVAINTAHGIGNVAEAVKDVRSVSEWHDGGEKTEFAVSGPRLLNVIAENLLYIEFAMKPPLVMRLEASLQELSETVDQLLIDSLEG